MYTLFYTLIKVNTIIDAIFKLLVALKHLVTQTQKAVEHYQQMSFEFTYEES